MDSGSTIYSDLLKLLINNIYINPQDHHKKKEIIEEKFFDDEFEDKRKYRLFSIKQKEYCWNRSRIVPGRHPDRWRYDAAGNLVMKPLRGCTGPFCHEYDHIIPYSKGGHTIIRNCQVLQTQVNKMKSNKTDLTEWQLRQFSIKKDYSKQQLDFLEEVIYGDVKK